MKALLVIVTLSVGLLTGCGSDSSAVPDKLATNLATTPPVAVQTTHQPTAKERAQDAKAQRELERSNARVEAQERRRARAQERKVRARERQQEKESAAADRASARARKNYEVTVVAKLLAVIDGNDGREDAYVPGIKRLAKLCGFTPREVGDKVAVGLKNLSNRDQSSAADVLLQYNEATDHTIAHATGGGCNDLFAGTLVLMEQQ